jgi:hypothetical protein
MTRQQTFEDAENLLTNVLFEAQRRSGESWKLAPILGFAVSYSWFATFF